MKKHRNVRVVKRDGSQELFQFAKLRLGLALAMRSTGYDDRYADALAKAVLMHLNEWAEARPPTTEYIFGCVKAVLDETGLSDVSAELDKFRRLRAMRRARIRVLTDVRSGPRLREWSKGEVARTLEMRHEIKPSVARILATEIEGRVLAMNYRVVSIALVDELIRNELIAWGLSDEITAADVVLPDESPVPAGDAETEIG